MVKILMLKRKGFCEKGTVLEQPDQEARQLIARGYAKEVLDGISEPLPTENENPLPQPRSLPDQTVQTGSSKRKRKSQEVDHE